MSEYTGPKQTPADKQEGRLAKLAEAAEALRSSAGWKTFLAMSARFHRYSFTNQMLIASQFPEATQVAGFKTWKTMGRSVMKGQKGIMIFAPCPKKNEAGEVDHVFFRAVYVFDISQTDGEPLPELEWPMLDQAGTEELEAKLIAHVEKVGFSYSTTTADVDATIKGGARGYYSSADKGIMIDGGLPSSARCAVILHELGHALDPKLAKRSQAERELLAESVAYLAGTRLGLAVEEEAAHYVASWEGTTETLAKVAADAVAIADKIADTISPQEAAQKEEVAA